MDELKIEKSELEQFGDLIMDTSKLMEERINFLTSELINLLNGGIEGSIKTNLEGYTVKIDNLKGQIDSTSNTLSTNISEEFINQIVAFDLFESLCN